MNTDEPVRSMPSSNLLFRVPFVDIDAKIRFYPSMSLDALAGMTPPAPKPMLQTRERNHG